jgi:hypothetical protein
LKQKALGQVAQAVHAQSQEAQQRQLDEIAAMEQAGRIATIDAAEQRASVYRGSRATRQKEMAPVVAEMRKTGWTKGADIVEQAAASQDFIDKQKEAAENRKIETEQIKEQVAQLEAQKRIAVAHGASAADTLGIDQQIGTLKARQAVLDQDIAAKIGLQADETERVKAAQEGVLQTGEARLSYMESLQKAGLMPQEAIDAEKIRLAAHYRYMASQRKAGSVEYYQYMQKAQDLLADDTQDRWQGIIGQILGAPSELVTSIVSGGFLARRFGDLGNALGIGKGINATVIGQNQSELIVKIQFDGPMDTLDAKVRAALPAAFQSFGRDIVGALAR